MRGIEQNKAVWRRCRRLEVQSAGGIHLATWSGSFRPRSVIKTHPGYQCHRSFYFCSIFIDEEIVGKNCNPTHALKCGERQQHAVFPWLGHDRNWCIFNVFKGNKLGEGREDCTEQVSYYSRPDGCGYQIVAKDAQDDDRRNVNGQRIKNADGASFGFLCMSFARFSVLTTAEGAREELTIPIFENMGAYRGWVQVGLFATCVTVNHVIALRSVGPAPEFIRPSFLHVEGSHCSPDCTRNPSHLFLPLNWKDTMSSTEPMWYCYEVSCPHSCRDSQAYDRLLQVRGRDEATHGM